MHYNILNLTNKIKWSDYLMKLPLDQQDIYFSPEYYQLYEQNGDGKAHCFVFEKDGELALYPFLINSVNELGYVLDGEYFDIQGAYGYNGIVSSSYEEDFISDFYVQFNEYCKSKKIIAEFTRFHTIINNHLFSENNMDILFDRKTVYLDISNTLENIWTNSYSSKNRNMIRKALKNNIEIIVSNEKDDYLKFYEIYVKTMKNVGSEKYLFFNEKYFLNFIKYLPDKHHLIIAKLGDEYIGGMILMTMSKFAHYHLSARKTEYGNLALNNLFLDYAVKLAKDKNCLFFHFGGGASYTSNDSLFKFKANFSKLTADFYIGKKVHNIEIYNEVIEHWKQKTINLDDNKLLRYRKI